jgi:hypothetical protein
MARQWHGDLAFVRLGRVALAQPCVHLTGLIIPSAVDPPGGGAGQARVVKVEHSTGFWRTLRDHRRVWLWSVIMTWVQP